MVCLFGYQTLWLWKQFELLQTKKIQQIRMPTFTRTKTGHRFNEAYCQKAQQAFWEHYFDIVYRECRESSVSEIIDINSGRKNRMAFRIAKTIRSGKHQPFVFITCLN